MAQLNKVQKKTIDYQVQREILQRISAHLVYQLYHS